MSSGGGRGGGRPGPRDADGGLAGSADPLPPPPLPALPPFGPDDADTDADTDTDADGEGRAPVPELKPVRRFVPDSWKSCFLRGPRPARGWAAGRLSGGARCSPPASPAWAPADDPAGDPAYYPAGDPAYYPAEDPAARAERLRARHAPMRSWAGLLRALGAAELLLGGGALACVAAYVHRDSEWHNLLGYGGYGGYGYGYGGYGGYGYGGYGYGGPRTAFVLGAAGLAWVATLLVLALGMSLFYRAVLLDSGWWPPSEFALNAGLCVLDLAAALVYVDDARRGGLCSQPLFLPPPSAALCRLEGGQAAGLVFFFVTVFLYLASALASLKLWRHEAARRLRERQGGPQSTQPSPPSERKLCAVAASDRQGDPAGDFTELRSTTMRPELRSACIPPGHTPRPVVMPDYVAKYPAIHTDDDRERYKAVFQDQFSEYKELSAEVQATLRKLDELGAVMDRLPQYSGHRQEHERISRIHEEFNRKKHDPSFLEKRERCDYLKKKLSHIKQRIQEYDKVMDWDVRGWP
ncbi:MARVEL domain-containing protein 2 [Perognathus longimembris pacificus]|uniref:MARVEL domain-containing protein 2 n=1 Tax=Perognathus longimembris pacificus TaxID=214514 RepID=UPI0020186C83|nr:MARVEL domain-containing protein 2 [Perognathus longimembris pacificus]